MDKERNKEEGRERETEKKREDRNGARRMGEDERKVAKEREQSTLWWLASHRHTLTRWARVIHARIPGSPRVQILW